MPTTKTKPTTKQPGILIRAFAAEMGKPFPRPAATIKPAKPAVAPKAPTTNIIEDKAEATKHLLLACDTMNAAFDEAVDLLRKGKPATYIPQVTTGSRADRALVARDAIAEAIRLVKRCR